MSLSERLLPADVIARRRSRRPTRPEFLVRRRFRQLRSILDIVLRVTL